MNNSHINRIIVWGIIIVGTILRLRQYLEQRSLWLDEAMISLNIVDRNPIELLGKLYYDQAAPVGFSYISKFFVSLLGNSELTLRLFPMLCGIFALYMLWRTALLINGKSFAVWPLLIIALSHPLIYYSNEVKQYMPDMLFAVIATYLFVRLSKNIRPRTLLYTSLALSFFVWFSHPLIFTIAAGILYLLFLEFQKTNKIQIKNALLIGTPILISFLLMYFVNLKNISGNNYLNEYWAHAFPKIFTGSIDDLKNSALLFADMFPLPLGLHFIPLAVIVFLGGIIFCWKKDRSMLLLLILPTIFTYTASCLGKYPFISRFLIFLAPSIVLIMAYFIDFLFTGNAIRKIAAILTMAVLLFTGSRISAYYFLNPEHKEELKDVMTYIEENSSGNESLYIYYSTAPAFRYYSPKIPVMKPDKTFFGSNNRDQPTKYISEINDFQRPGDQFWFIMSHYHNNEKELILDHIRKSGEIRDSVIVMGASAFLHYRR